METPEIELKIKVMYEDELILHCHEGDTVKQLKQLISEKTSIPVDHQKLIFRGRVLDDDKLLSECNVEDRCVLSLIKVEPRPLPIPAEQHTNRTEGTNRGSDDLNSVINPLVQTITSTIGSLFQGNVQVNSIPRPLNSSTTNTTPDPSTSSDLLDAVLEESTNRNAQEATTNQPPSSSNTTPTTSVADTINAANQRLMYDNSRDETEHAVISYIVHLQQLAINLQKRLRETNFNSNAWKKVQDTLREHVQLTQSLIQLPSPSQNRLEPQQVDIVATSIPIPLGRGGFSLQNLFGNMNNQNGNTNSQGGNNSQNQNNDYNNMYMFLVCLRPLFKLKQNCLQVTLQEN